MQLPLINYDILPVIPFLTTNIVLSQESMGICWHGRQRIPMENIQGMI